MEQQENQEYGSALQYAKPKHNRGAIVAILIVVVLILASIAAAIVLIVREEGESLFFGETSFISKDNDDGKNHIISNKKDDEDDGELSGNIVGVWSDGSEEVEFTEEYVIVNGNQSEYKFEDGYLTFYRNGKQTSKLKCRLKGKKLYVENDVYKKIK